MNKKLLCLILTLVMLLSLAACGSQKTDEPAQDNTVENETPEGNQEPEAADPDVGVPAEPTEEPDAAPEMPEVNPDGETVPKEESKPEEPKPEEPKPEENPQAPTETPSTSVDLEAFYNEIYATLYPADADGNATGPFVMDMGMDPAMADGFYPGLAALNPKQMHIYMPGMSGVPYELVLVEVASASDVDAVKAILQARIDTELQNHMNYPMVLENWELNSRIVSNGSFVMMAVSADCDAYVEAFNALF